MDHSLSVFFSKFSWNFSSARKAKLFICGSIGLFICIVFITVFVKPFSVNISPSAPRGIYMVLPGAFYDYGDFLLVSCPEDYPPLAKKGDTLLKTVRGFPGDRYTVTDKELIINEQSYPIYRADYLPHLTPGVYVVPEGTLLCLNNPEFSFDSRYIGPVAISNIQHKVFQILDYDRLDKTITWIYELFRLEVPYAGSASKP